VTTDYTLDGDGFIVKTDPNDVGVRMKPAAPGVAYEYPENAHSPAPKRNDYTNVTQLRVHWRRGRHNVFGEFEPAPR